MIGLWTLVTSIFSIIDMIISKKKHYTEDFSYSLVAFSAVPAAIVWLITLFRPNVVILKRRFAICYIVSGTVGILIGYGHFLIYVLKNQVAGIVCVHRGCFQSSKLLLIVAAYIIFGYILMIYFTFVLWARYKEFEIET